jgi:hypothetical protein
MTMKYTLALSMQQHNIMIYGRLKKKIFINIIPYLSFTSTMYFTFDILRRRGSYRKYSSFFLFLLLLNCFSFCPLLHHSSSIFSSLILYFLNEIVIHFFS